MPDNLDTPTNQTYYARKKLETLCHEVYNYYDPSFFN